MAQNTKNSYDWVRTPIGGGDPIRITGELANKGSVDIMFSPTLASLMPMEIGAKFKLPQAYPRKGGRVSSEFDEYTVLRKEHLELDSGVSCDCWVIESKTWGGTVSHFWVSREAPFVYRRHRDVGGRRDFVSNVTSYRVLD
ncbi:MAG: hypothetical protein COA47_11530 [Robiginitomaculum sp.]|nr:MAG: hypothetical protein COA47_11530 [Robiginitomaculum sp.]